MIRTQQIHGFAQLVQINKRTHNDNGTQYIPQPKINFAEVIGNSAIRQIIANPRGHLMKPHNRRNAAGNGRYNKCQQAKVHGISAIVGACTLIDILGKSGVEHN